LKRRNSPDEQVGEVGYKLPVAPPFHFAVTLADGVQVNHQLVAIPLTSVGLVQRHNFEAEVRRWIE
jgi:hypothetical protein